MIISTSQLASVDIRAFLDNKVGGGRGGGDMCETGYMMVPTRTRNHRRAMKVTWGSGFNHGLRDRQQGGGIVHKILTLHHPRIYILYMGLLYLDWSVWLVFFFF